MRDDALRYRRILAHLRCRPQPGPGQALTGRIWRRLRPVQSQPKSAACPHAERGRAPSARIRPRVRMQRHGASDMRLQLAGGAAARAARGACVRHFWARCAACTGRHTRSPRGAAGCVRAPLRGAWYTAATHVTKPHDGGIRCNDPQAVPAPRRVPRRVTPAQCVAQWRRCWRALPPTCRDGLCQHGAQRRIEREIAACGRCGDAWRVPRSGLCTASRE
jgi:hypothetical protein